MLGFNGYTINNVHLFFIRSLGFPMKKWPFFGIPDKPKSHSWWYTGISHDTEKKYQEMLGGYTFHQHFWTKSDGTFTMCFLKSVHLRNRLFGGVLTLKRGDFWCTPKKRNLQKTGADFTQWQWQCPHVCFTNHPLKHVIISRVIFWESNPNLYRMCQLAMLAVELNITRSVPINPH